MQIDAYQLAATRARYEQRAAIRQRNLYRIARGELLAADTPERVRMFLARRGVSPDQAESLIASKLRPAISATESVGVREPDALERIIGTSDLMGVAFLERGLDMSRTVARIWVGIAAGSPAAYGTGFMISPRLLMTNNHVLPDAPTARASRAQFNYQLGPDGRECPAALFSLDPSSFFLTDHDLDYAVVAVASAADNGRPLIDFGFNAMLQEEGKAIVAQWLNIIQHPSGGYKQLALRENHLVDVSERFLTYQTDTAPGSSGSPVYNDRWEVIGLHHSGVKATDPQGRVLAIDGQVWTPEMGEDRIKWVANEGIRISVIIADLKAKATGSAQKAVIDEMIAQAAAATLPPAPRADSRGAGGGHEASRLMQPDGSASWTIPLTITVKLPCGGAAAAPDTATIGQQVTDLGSGGGAPPAPDGSDPTAVLGEAKRVFGARSDVLSVRAGYLFENGWITKKPAIVVKVRKRQPPASLREAGIAPLPASFHGMPVEVINPSIDDLLLTHPQGAAAEALRRAAPTDLEIVYKPPEGAKLREVTARMVVQAAVSPDDGWPMLRDFLAGTKNKLVVGMYDFGATHIRDAIVKMAKPAAFKQMTLAIQAGSDEGKGTKVDDLPDDEMVEQIESKLKDKFRSAWVKIGIKNGWVATSYHIKVAVRDSVAFWLSSGNWQSSNQPPADPSPLREQPQQRSWLTKYNRDWHVVVEHAELAAMFEKYLVNDFERNQELAEQESIAMPDVLLPAALFVESAEERTAAFEYFPPFKDTRDFTVQPLLTPDNYFKTLLDLVKSAENQLRIQNQTFNAATEKQTDLGALLDAIIERQNAGVEVRIIFRTLDTTKTRENLEALQDNGFDMKNVKVQRNCHTKGVMVDGRHVMIGSQNISQLGITLNRDASLLFRNEPKLTAYFVKIFDHDWRNLAQQNIGAEKYAPELASPGAATPPGMERLSWRDYIEMA